MLRRRISLFGLAALGLAVLMLTPEPASAQLLGRFRARRDTTPMPAQPVTTATGTSPAGTVIMMEETPARMGPLRRLFSGRRGSEPVFYTTPVPMTTTGTTTAITTTAAASPSTTVVTTSEPVYQTRPARRFLSGRRGSSSMYFVEPAPTSTSTTPSGTRVSYYPPETTDSAPAATLLRLLVPAQAEILFDGQKTTQTGTLRDFITPPLERASNYTFEIQAKWTENGREVSRTEKVKFLGGQRVNLDFRATAPRGTLTP